MVPLPNMPPDNTDFNALLTAFTSPNLRLLDEDMISHKLQAQELYRDERWPNGMIMTRSFVQPKLPEEELAVSPCCLLNYHLRHNENVRPAGPDLVMNERALNCIAMASLMLRTGASRGYVKPNHPFRHLRYENPFSSVGPYPLMFTEVNALNNLYKAVEKNTPKFPQFDNTRIDALMLQFAQPVTELVRGALSAMEARDENAHKRRGNRGWYQIISLEFRPLLARLLEKIRDAFDGETDGDFVATDGDLVFEELPFAFKAVLSDIIQAMTVAVLANDERFTAAEVRRKEERAMASGRHDEMD